MQSQQFIVSLLVNNHSGVLTRVSSLSRGAPLTSTA